MADIDIENVDKLKVAELRALLSSHDLDTKGTKPILVTRLKSYLESLPAGGGESSPVKADAEPEEKEDAPADEGRLLLFYIPYSKNMQFWTEKYVVA